MGPRPSNLNIGEIIFRLMQQPACAQGGNQIPLAFPTPAGLPSDSDSVPDLGVGERKMASFWAAALIHPGIRHLRHRTAGLNSSLAIKLLDIKFAPFSVIAVAMAFFFFFFLVVVLLSYFGFFSPSFLWGSFSPRSDIVIASHQHGPAQSLGLARVRDQRHSNSITALFVSVSGKQTAVHNGGKGRQPVRDIIISTPILSTLQHKPAKPAIFKEGEDFPPFHIFPLLRVIGEDVVCIRCADV